MQEHSTVKLSAKQQQMLEHLRRANQQGQRLREYAELHGLSLKAMYQYQWLLRKKGLLGVPEQLPFIRVSTAPTKSVGVCCRIFFPNGIHVAVDGDGTALFALLQQVQSL